MKKLLPDYVIWSLHAPHRPVVVIAKQESHSIWRYHAVQDMFIAFCMGSITFSELACFVYLCLEMHVHGICPHDDVCSVYKVDCISQSSIDVRNISENRWQLHHVWLMLGKRPRPWPSYSPALINVSYLIGYLFFSLHIYNDQNKKVSQQTRGVGPMLGWFRPIVYDAGPASARHWAKASCLLGLQCYTWC